MQRVEGRRGLDISIRITENTGAILSGISKSLNAIYINTSPLIYPSWPAQ